VPLAVKIAPDLDDAQIDDIARIVPACGIDAVIATNTTIDKSALGASPQYAKPWVLLHMWPKSTRPRCGSCAPTGESADPMSILHCWSTANAL